MRLTFRLDAQDIDMSGKILGQHALPYFRECNFQTTYYRIIEDESRHLWRMHGTRVSGSCYALIQVADLVFLALLPAYRLLVEW